MSVNPYAVASPPGRPSLNRQAKATVGILNTVRWIVTIVFGLMAALTVLGALLGLTSNGGVYAFAGLAAAAVLALWAALIYAVVGWYVDSLNLLVQIEENTKPAV